MTSGVRHLLVRLNRGNVAIRYRVFVRSRNRVSCGWWVDGRENADSGLNVVEKLIVEALVYADTK